MSEKDAATVFEEAADLLLVNGRCRGDAVDDAGRLCVVAALSRADNYRIDSSRTLRSWLRDHEVESARMAPDSSVFCPVQWNDRTEDDDEVRDTLLLVAKQLRGEAKP